MKERTIYTRWLAVELLRQGFQAIRVEPNPDKPYFDCWVFAETPEFKLAFANTANRKR